ncbi:hypothetical protein CTI12_AA196040 [Artemisia annua]|uniref:Replication protein A 70 kDa DNA-binding subunit B/D first OB fold domain-containing protein n=1 Tax=Artemisia annua TaxID=35608 RepID=A0A2U1P426_ARTAN|nr:hypothetical protein CTI12_AA196040 [Artemisia annua]
MKVKRKGVANENAKDMCIQVSQPLGSDTSYSNGVSTSNSIGYLGVGRVGHDGVAPVYPAIISDGVRAGVLDSTSFCGSIPGSSSGNVSTMGITHMVDGYPFENAVHDTHLDERSLLHSGVEAQLDPPINIPVQVPTIDGSVSVFQSNNIMYPSYTAIRSAGVPQVVERPSVYGHQSATHIPMVLDFSTGSVTRVEDLTVSSSTIRLAAPQAREAARPTRQAARRHVLAARRRILNARPRVTASVNLPAQGPVAPPQRQGAPLDYKCFGRCDQVHERYALRESIIEGLIGFLDDNNALVKLFRTAREKVQRADIPNFTIRLFGVAGANQYELPTADSVGAIVYEGGPESMTDYDVVIERHSGEPESVNKLHPAYMALQFPLLFIYGEEGYHLRLKLRNVDGNDDQQEKKMSMKLYYAYQLHDRAYIRLAFASVEMALTIDPARSPKNTEAVIIPARQAAYLTELNPADNSKFIEVRVYRKWTAIKIPGFTPVSFSCILLDKKGSAVQANADLKEKQRFERDLQINNVYKIQGFGFEKADSWGKTLDNDFTLCFGKYTQIEQLSNNDFPYHYFNFAAFNELNTRLEKKNPILTGIISN